MSEPVTRLSPMRARSSHGIDSLDSDIAPLVRALTSPTIAAGVGAIGASPNSNKMIQTTPGASAARAKRLSTYVSIDYRAIPASPTFRRSRQSASRNARLGSTAYSGSEGGPTDTSPTFSHHRLSLGQIEFVVPSTPGANTEPPMSYEAEQNNSSSALRGELQLPQQVLDFSPQAQLPPLDAAALRDHNNQLRGGSGGSHATNTPGMPRRSSVAFASGMGVGAPNNLLSMDDACEEHQEVLRDFYESELLLFRNFGVDQQETSVAATAGGSRRSSQAQLTVPLSAFDHYNNSSQNQQQQQDSPSAPFTMVVPPVAAMRRRSSNATPGGGGGGGGGLSPVPPEPGSYDVERRSAMRRRGSHSTEPQSAAAAPPILVGGDDPTSASPFSQASHSPHHNAPHSPFASAAVPPSHATLFPGLGTTTTRASKSPMRQRGDSPTGQQRGSRGLQFSFTAATDDGAIFEIVTPPLHADASSKPSYNNANSSNNNSDSPAGTGSPHDPASQRLSPAGDFQPLRPRSNSNFVAFCETETGTFDIHSSATPLRRDSAARNSVANTSMSGNPLLGSSTNGTRRRGSWLETADGAPRSLTSSSRRAIKGVAVVDMEQEFTRYTNKTRHSEDWDGACGCDEETICRHIGKVSAETIDATTMFHHCSWCQRRPASFLCLHCGRTLCPSHVKAHADDDSMENCVLFINTLDITTSYDRIYWCERCTSFTFKHTDAYCAIADALVTTRKTYLAAPATDIFMQHYQIVDYAASSVAFAKLRGPPSPQNITSDLAPTIATAFPPPQQGSSSSSAFTTAAEAKQATVRLIASVASMQGWRSTQEDSEVVFYLPLSSLNIDAEDYGGEAALPATQFSVFCVFDGHGGDAVAKIASHHFESHFVRSIQDQLQRKREQLLAEPTYFSESERNREAFYKDVLTGAYISLDRELEDTPDGRDGFYGTVGCTALVVVITPLDIVCASAGDSRACLFDAHRARTHALSVDHTLDDDNEIQRVQNAGYSIREGRIEGQLAVPRAFGDFEFKMCGGRGPEGQAVSCVPDVHLIPRRQLQLSDTEEAAMASSSRLPPMSGNSPLRANSASGLPMPEEWFVVLGCDGIWEVFSNEDCCAALQEAFVSERRARQLEQYLANLKLANDSNQQPSPMSTTEHSPTVSMAGSLPVGRRSRHGSMRSGHPSQQVVLHANTLNDIVASSICGVLKRAVALDADGAEGKGMDNMSIIVVRLALTA